MVEPKKKSKAWMLLGVIPIAIAVQLGIHFSQPEPVAPPTPSVEVTALSLTQADDPAYKGRWLLVTGSFQSLDGKVITLKGRDRETLGVDLAEPVRARLQSAEVDKAEAMNWTPSPGPDQGSVEAQVTLMCMGDGLDLLGFPRLKHCVLR